MKLRAVPKKWFSWDFILYEDNRPIAEIDFARLRESGQMKVGGVSYAVRAQGPSGGVYTLEANNEVLARAKKSGGARRSFTVEYDGKQYTLEAASAFTRRFVLRENNRSIGTVYAEHHFTRTVIVDVPPESPLPVRVFLTWLAIVLWKRESDVIVSAAAAAGSV